MRSTKLRLLIAAGLLVSAVLASVQSAGAQTAVSTPGGRASGAGVSAASVSCGRVLFIGARGSGEAGPGTSKWKPGKKDRFGLGSQVNSAYVALAKDLGKGRTLLPVSVVYRADSVDLLWSVRTAPGYFSDLGAGVSFVLGYLRAEAITCPDQQIVLAGYSQGAMVMHRVLRDLGDTPQDQAILARVADAILIADGDQVPRDNDITRYGSASLGAFGAGLGLPALSHSSTAKLPPDVGARVLSICNDHDPVCDFTSFVTQCAKDPGGCAKLRQIHSGYIGTKPALEAASRTAHDLLGQVSWTAVKAPMPTNTTDGYFAAQINDVTCPSTTVCVAVGYDDPGGTPTYGLIWWWSGGRWTVSEPKLPAAAGVYEDVDLTSVSCATPTACLIVGSYDDQLGSYGLLLSGSGSSWAPLEVNPSGSYTAGPVTYLNSVHCLSLQTCVVAGVYRNSAGNSRGLVLWGAGLSWKVSEIALPAGADSADQAELNSVACRSSSACFAVGEYRYVAPGEGPSWYPMVVSGADGSWQPKTAPLPALSSQYAGGDAYLETVTCPSEAHCLAFGTDGGAPVLLWSTASSWTPVVAPSPINTFGLWSLAPGQVACVSQAECELVGTLQTVNSSFITPTVWTGNAARWSRTSPPFPANADKTQGGRMDSVTCAAGGKCLVFGSYADASYTERGMILSGTGSSWTAQQTPLPSGTPAVNSRYLSIDAASCVAASHCAAVGTYETTGGGAEYGLLLIEQPRATPAA